MKQSHTEFQDEAVGQIYAHRSRIPTQKYIEGNRSTIEDVQNLISNLNCAIQFLLPQSKQQTAPLITVILFEIAKTISTLAFENWLKRHVPIYLWIPIAIIEMIYNTHAKILIISCSMNNQICVHNGNPLPLSTFDEIL